MSQAHCVCAGLDDTLFVGEGGSAATLAQEELHAALTEVKHATPHLDSSWLKHICVPVVLYM